MNKKFWIAWFQLAVVAAAAPFFLFPSLKNAWVFAVVFALLAVCCVLKGGLLERTPIDWSLGILFMMILASCFRVPDIGFSLPKIAGLLFGLVVFYSLQEVLNSEKVLKITVNGYFAAGIGLGVFGLMGMMLSSIEAPFVKTVSKIFKILPKTNWKLPGAEWGFNPNPLGGTLLLIIPLGIVLWIHYRKQIAGYMTYAAGSMVLFMVIFLTQTYGAWISLLISLWILAFGPKLKKWSLLAFGLAMIVIFFVQVHTISAIPAMVQKNVLKTKIEQRYPFWSAGIKAIVLHPFFGVGLNRLRLDPEIGQEASHAHNQLIHTAAELGISALVAYLAILIGLGWMCREICRKAAVGWMRTAARGLGAGQLAFFLFGMGDAVPLGTKPGIFFWISLAIIAALYNHVIRNCKEKVYTHD